MKTANIQIGSKVIGPGEKQQFLEAVYDTGLTIPITVINGVKEGKTLLLTSGVHCCEFPGIQAAVELAKEFDPEEIRGQVVIVHPLNISGFAACNYTSRVPEDDQNLNRVFPGDRNGSISEKLAHFVVEELQKKADFYIDMHGGNTQEELSPYVYYVTATTEETKDMARMMAEHVNVTHMVGSKVASQGSYNYAGSCGIPSILIERGCKGQWTKEEVELYKEDIRNVMRFLNIKADRKEAVRYSLENISEAYYDCVKHTGMWYPAKRAGDFVKAGELAGEVRDYFGNVVERILFQCDGVILYQTSSLCIKEGDEAVAYGR